MKTLLPRKKWRSFSHVSDQIATAIENALASQEIWELKDKLAQEKAYLDDEIRDEMNF